jgi:hypothetical protein
LIIWGFRTKALALAMLVARCALQGHTAAHHLVKQQTKFTLFFIPLFPVRTKHLLSCAMCGGSAPVAKERVPEVLNEAARQEHERSAQQFAEFHAPQPEISPN